MASAFPLQRETDHTPQQQTTVIIDGETTGDVLQIMSSTTAQRILGELRINPGTASDLADATDTSLQNAHYHLERLTDAGLIEPIDTWYSAKGRKMTVYALVAEELLITFGADHNPTPE